MGKKNQWESIPIAIVIILLSVAAAWGATQVTVSEAKASIEAVDVTVGKEQERVRDLENNQATILEALQAIRSDVTEIKQSLRSCR